MYIAQQAFSAYGPSYWAVSALFASGALLLVLVGRRQTEVQARRFGRLFGAVTGAIYGSAMVYSAIPLGSSLMSFRFLQVAWAFWHTGELPHHDHAHVEGVADEAPLVGEVFASGEEMEHAHMGRSDPEWEKSHPHTPQNNTDKET